MNTFIIENRVACWSEQNLHRSGCEWDGASCGRYLQYQIRFIVSCCAWKTDFLNLAPMMMMSFIFDTDCHNQSAKLGNGVIAPENVCLLSVTISCFLVHPHFAVFVQGASNFHFFIPEFLTPKPQSNYECSRCHLRTFQDVLKWILTQWWVTKALQDTPTLFTSTHYNQVHFTTYNLHLQRDVQNWMITLKLSDYSPLWSCVIQLLWCLLSLLLSHCQRVQGNKC